MPQQTPQPPILFVDVDGVISLFGFPSEAAPPGQFHWVDGIAHCISDAAGAAPVPACAQTFELVWATGWEEKANEYLPLLLDLPDDELPVLTFDGRAVFGTAHWKLGRDRRVRGRPPGRVDRRFARRALHDLGGRRAPPRPS